jgi:predicted DNA-binding transcriptional regulator AlpA
MHNLVLSQIDTDVLIASISKKVTSDVIEALRTVQKTTEEAKQWLDLNELIEYDPEKRTKATWYSKISKGEVPYHKGKKKVFFLKSEIDNWLKSGKQKTNIEIEAEAEAFLSNNKKRLQ